MDSISDIVFEIGKLYYDPERECVVRLFAINPKSAWPYKVDEPNGNGVEGNHKEASWTSELWDKNFILEEIENLKAQIKVFKKVIKQLDKPSQSSH